MGRDLVKTFPEARALFKQADDILSVPLSRYCWEGPAEVLTATENAQPAILLHSYAVWRVIRPALEGDVVVGAGHSLGEFTAHLLAGTFSFADALTLVRRRGELMARSGRERPGTMAAILGLEPESVAELCRDVNAGIVVAANFNAPGQIVISGEEVAVERASSLALERGARRAVPLDVSGAFHSPLMADAREGLRAALEEVSMSDPIFPVISNVSAAAVTTATKARQTLVAQLTSPVRWAESVEAMRRFEPDRWFELGPGRVLTGLLRRIDRSQEVDAVGDAASARALLDL